MGKVKRSEEWGRHTSGSQRAGKRMESWQYSYSGQQIEKIQPERKGGQTEARLLVSTWESENGESQASQRMYKQTKAEWAV